MKAARQINVAFSGDSLPFSYVGDGNRPAGYSIDLCKRVIAHLGRVVGVPDLKVNWRVGTVTERIDMVASGKADLDCANTTATRTRMKKVDFSSLVFLEGGGIIVKAGASIQKFPDLAGKRIGVIDGTTTAVRLDAMLKQKLISAKVTRVKDGNEGVAMLESGSLDAFASDKIKLLGLAMQAKHPEELAMMQEDLSWSRSRSRCRATTPRSASKSTARSRRCTWAARSTGYSPRGSARLAARPACWRRCTCSIPFQNEGRRGAAGIGRNVGAPAVVSYWRSARCACFKETKMLRKLMRLTLVPALVAVGTFAAMPAYAQSEQQQLVNNAEKTLSNFLRDPQMTWLQRNIGRAYGVLIAPEVVKAGFIFGGSGGRGVLSAATTRQESGTVPCSTRWPRRASASRPGSRVAETSRS